MKIYEEIMVAGHWLPALINDDITGLSDNEEKELDGWLDNLPEGAYITTGPDQEPSFEKDDITGLMAECYQVTIILEEYHENHRHILQKVRE